MNASLPAETALLTVSAAQRNVIADERRAIDQGIIDAVASVAPALARADAAIIAAGARLLINAPRERWRITRAVYGPAVSAIWPPQPGMTATDVLAECHRRITIQEGFSARQEWHLFDRNRWLALRQAETALLAIIMSEGR